MSGIRSRGIVALLFAASTVGTALVGACADSKGALMLAINTDMKAPKDVNAVSVTISTNGAIKHSFIGRVTPQGEVLLPATLAIVEPEDKAASIRIRVMAFQDRKPRVLRDVRTTIPQDGRTALLRIPLNFVNDGSAMGPELPANILPDPNPGTGGPPSGGGGASSGGGGPVGGGAGDFDFLGTFTPPPNCDPTTQTIIDGECKDSFVDPATLPDFDASQVGDSTNPGSCFDVPKCFAGAVAIGEETGEKPPPVAPADAGSSADSGADGDGERDGGAKFKNFRPLAVTLDRNACSLQLNGANPARLNLALVTPDTGECVRPGECYVPLDRGNGGWKEQNGVVQLPTFVCRLLTGKNLRLATSTETCAAKEESNPICGPPPGAVEPNACVGSKAPPASAPSNMVLRLTQLNLGELDSVTNMPAANAWKKIGFDLDGLCTTKEAMDVCARQAGADSAKQEDGEQGIDNAFGRTVLGFLLGLVPTPSKTASEGGGFLQLDAAGNGTLHIPVQGGLWSIPLIDVRVDRKAGEEVVGGTLAARIPVESLVQSVEKIAGRISSQLCGGSTLDTLKQTIRQAADLPLQGQNRLGVPCDAVSIGITFTGTPTEPVTLPPPGPDPCGPMECPRTAPIDATTLPAKPARVNPFQCTPPAIDALVSYVLANPNATPAMVKSLGVTDPMCRACVFGPESGNTWAPFVELTAGGLLVNRGGCIEVATSSQNCGRAYQQIYSCVLLACRDCAAGAATSACVNQAAQPGGACAKAVSDAVGICGGPPLGSAETACEGRDLIEGPLKALCGQGVQMN